MLKTTQLERLTPESHETLLTILKTLPGALFVLDDTATILYANASAQALTGVAPEILVGNSFWRCAPQVVSTALYQAIQQTKLRQEAPQLPGHLQQCSAQHGHRLPTQVNAIAIEVDTDNPTTR